MASPESKPFDSCPSLNDPRYIHARVAIHPRGRPIHRVTELKEVMVGLRDAMAAHAEAYRAGILHRNISPDVILSYGTHAVLVDINGHLQQAVPVSTDEK